MLRQFRQNEVFGRKVEDHPSNTGTNPRAMVVELVHAVVAHRAVTANHQTLCQSGGSITHAQRYLIATQRSKLRANRKKLQHVACRVATCQVKRFWSPLLGVARYLFDAHSSAICLKGASAAPTCIGVACSACT